MAGCHCCYCLCGIFVCVSYTNEDGLHTVREKIEFDRRFKERWDLLKVNVFGQKKLLKDKRAALFTLCSFTDLFLSNLEQLTSFGKDSHRITSSTWTTIPCIYILPEIVTLVILIAVFWAFHRRYVEKLVRLKRNFKSGLVLIFIGGLMISVLLGNGMGIIWHGEELSWSEPIASAIAYVFSGINETAAISVFYFSWWVHLLILLTF